MNLHRLPYDPDRSLHRQLRPSDHVPAHEAHTRCHDLSPSAPDPRDLGAEYAQSLDAAYQGMDKEAAVNANRLKSSYNTLSEIAPQAVQLMGSIQPQLSQQTATANSAQRAADIADIEKYGAQAVQAIQSSNPQQKALLDRLNADALGGLESGNQLDASQQRLVSQATRSGQAARGFGYGMNDVSAEALASLGYGDQLANQRRGFATQIAGVNQATGVDPALVLTGRASSVPGAASGVIGQTQGMQAGTAYNPLNSYASDLFNTNYNADAASRIAGSNNAAGVIGGGLSAL